MEESGNSKSRARYYLRVLRPLFWWFLFALVLYGIRTHQRLMEQTRLTYSTWLNGLPVATDARFDGQPIASGAKIPLGHHTFTITQPKAVPFSTNLFIWYGGRDFGAIQLKRAKGVLSVNASPVAPLLSIEGDEYSVSLTNSSGLNATVPTGEYTITARYPYSTWQDRVKVYTVGLIPVRIDPRLGTLRLTCNKSCATYELLRVNVEPMLSGDLPATLTDLPENAYKVVARHHDHEWTKMFYLKAGTTNTIDVDFQYGAALLETTPPGAVVFDSAGTQRGVTPLTLSELQPGKWKFNLRLNDYEPVTATLAIEANQTNSFRTNLISQSYERAMQTARELMNAEKYEEAAQSLADALHVQPGDAAALALQKEAVGSGSIARAESFGKQGDYIAGIKELDKALAALPDNERGKNMLADFKQHEPEQRARLEREHIEAWTNAFNAFTAKITGAALVETHELDTAKPVAEVRRAIVEQFRSVEPIFRLSHVGWTNDIFFMDADQEVSGGGRLCMIVGAQINDHQTRIAFKVIEYKSEALGLKILGAVLASATSTTYQSNYKPINPSDAQTSESDKKRISEGMSLTTEKIKKAIGEARNETTVK
jgi:tetratricopeptide (TPR) repeat protein